MDDEEAWRKRYLPRGQRFSLTPGAAFSRSLTYSPGMASLVPSRIRPAGAATSVSAWKTFKCSAHGRSSPGHVLSHTFGLCAGHDQPRRQGLKFDCMTLEPHIHPVAKVIPRGLLKFAAPRQARSFC